MPPETRKTKILVDGGDPEETLRVKSMIGFVDGQTTNPSLVAKNPEIRRRIASGHRLSVEEQSEEYKRIVRKISPLVGDAGVSIEVFADLGTTAEQMLGQGEEMFSWIPNAYIKYPCTHEGLRAAQMSVERGIRVNITLCFSQEQAGGVYAATHASKAPAYVSPFIGRLDDRGENGMDLIKNIQRMYEDGDGHVHVLAASIRSVDQLLACFSLGVELVTAPTKVLEAWAAKRLPMPDRHFVYRGVDTAGKPLKPIPYENIDLNKSWTAFDLRHDLTTKGIEKFVADFEGTVRQAEPAG
ncbi:MAG TPA: transaldolase family protein [Acidobacteriaceae bacterium]|nr:transaldolase family protein [Acidobacteriaceae bacterium]